MYLLQGVAGGMEFCHNLFHNSIVLLRAAGSGVSGASSAAKAASTNLSVQCSQLLRARYSMCRIVTGSARNSTVHQ